LKQEKLAGATLLVFCNKQDVAGALLPADIKEVLELDLIENRHWMIIPCSAMTGEGLLEGMEWVVGDIK
jgi:ADP-ribosylation factor-like protein 2